MSTQISAYRRVASLYKWDYQKAEMALADAMAQLNRLRRTCHKLDAEIDALLESGAGTPAAFDTSMREAVLRLVAELNGKLAAYRQAYDAQILVVLDLRKALMMARVRKDKSLEKHREAVSLHRLARSAKEVEELTDVYAANLFRSQVAATAGRG
jgi:chromosome segregation ATPase